MSASNESDLLSADVDHGEKRRLSILDLMLAMAAFALALGLRQNLTQVPGTPNPRDPFWGALFFWNTVGFNTTTLFGIILLVRSRWGPIQWPVWQPGHSMLIMQLTNILFSIFASVVAQQAEVSSPMTLDGFWQAAFITSKAGAILASAIVAAIGIFAFRGTWWWAVSFFLLTLSFLSSLIVQSIILAPTVLDVSMGSEFQRSIILVNTISGFTMLLGCLLALVSIIIDLVKKIPRDAAHWIGLVSFISQMILTHLLFMLALRYLGPSELFDL